MQTRSKTILARSKHLVTPTKVKTHIPVIPEKPVKVARERRQIFTNLCETCNDSDNDSTSTYDDTEETYRFVMPRQRVECDLFEPEFRRNLFAEYDNNIDFDDASRAWRANKIRIGEGQFAYKRTKHYPKSKK